MKNKKLKIFLICLMIAIAIAFCIFAIPYILSLKDPSNQEVFITKINKLGALGYLILLLIQIAQVIFAIIPGEPIEIIAGLMYGPIGGLIICLIGCLIGSTLVFVLVRKLGMNFVNKVINSEKFNKLDFLKNEKKRDILIFLLFFIIGTPKDILTYFAPFSGISLVKFLIISTFARIPSIITSTYAGNSLSSGNIWKFVIVFVITGIIGIIGIIIYTRILDKHNKKA